MLNKSHHDVFHTIIQNQNDQLMAGLFQGVLKFQLTVTEADGKNVYIGQITSLEDNQEMKEDFNTLEMVLDHLNQFKSVRLNKNKKDFPLGNEVSLTLTHQVSNKLYQYVTVLLKIKHVCLEDIIERCHKGDGLRDNEIKNNFSVLSKQIIELKHKIHNSEVRETILDGTLEQMNNKTTQQIKENSQKFLEFQKQVSLEIEKFQKKVSLEIKPQQSVMQKQQNRIVDRFNSLMVNMKQEHQRYMKQFDKQKELWEEQNSNVKDKMEKLSKKLQMSKQFVDFMNKEKENEQKKRYEQELSLYKQQKNFLEFCFDGKRLIKITDKCLKQFIFFNQIPFEKEFIFKIKVIQDQQKFIMIGLIDYDKQKQFQYSIESKNALSQSASQLLINPDRIDLTGQMDLGEVSEDNVVEVRVERKEKSIKWIVNGQEKISQVNDMIGDKNRKLYPYVQMYNAGGTIEIDFE